MNDATMMEKPAKLIPVLIGGAAITASAVIPGINFLNCLCCAGVMGGAILAVWFYKKNFPYDMPFRISDGVIVGTLSGLVGSVLTAIIETITMGLGSEQARFEMEQEIERAFDQAATQGSDPAVLEGVQQFMTTVLTNPFMLFLMVLVFTALVFTGFGALGGVIGGNIFKTKDLPTPADPMN